MTSVITLTAVVALTAVVTLTAVAKVKPTAAVTHKIVTGTSTLLYLYTGLQLRL